MYSLLHAEQKPEYSQAQRGAGVCQMYIFKIPASFLFLMIAFLAYHNAI